MKALAFLLLVACTASTFASTGILWSRHYTIRTSTKVCAVDVIKLDTGRIMSEKSCFLIK